MKRHEYTRIGLIIYWTSLIESFTFCCNSDLLLDVMNQTPPDVSHVSNHSPLY